MLLYDDIADLAICQGNSRLKYFAQMSFMRSILNSDTFFFIYNFKMRTLDFPGSPGIKTPIFQFRR